ncbi:hypothetical protein [Methanolobus sp.]|uniref:hypothetical protein n=1 Tax=Methanolobus sp. TaxID=1874737 RepID=UPI0025F5804D|nr:hypothetical protein [Methanolobus sp.]
MRNSLVRGGSSINWALNLKSTAYTDENRSISKNELKNMLQGLKSQYNWLKDEPIS